MPFVEIKQGGPDIPDGVYPLQLNEIRGDENDPEAPRHVVPEQGPNAGKDLYFWDWIFVVDTPGQPGDGEELRYGTSTATGPRSKMFGLLTALFNGVRPPVGTKLEKKQLIGRRVLATIARDEAGYVDIVNISAMPTSMQSQGFANDTGSQTRGTPIQAAATDDLPF